MDHPRTPQIDQMIDGGAHRAAGVQNVVEENDDLVGDIERNPRVVDGAARQQRVQVVTIESDVHLAYGNLFAVALLDDLSQPLGDIGAAGPDTDENDLVKAAVLFRHLASKTLEDNFDLRGVEDTFFLCFI